MTARTNAAPTTPLSGDEVAGLIGGSLFFRWTNTRGGSPYWPGRVRWPLPTSGAPGAWMLPIDGPLTKTNGYFGSHPRDIVRCSGERLFIVQFRGDGMDFNPIDGIAARQARLIRECVLPSSHWFAQSTVATATWALQQAGVVDGATGATEGAALLAQARQRAARARLGRASTEHLRAWALVRYLELPVTFYLTRAPAFAAALALYAAGVAACGNCHVHPPERAAVLQETLSRAYLSRGRNALPPISMTQAACDRHALHLMSALFGADVAAILLTIDGREGDTRASRYRPSSSGRCAAHGRP